MHLLRSNHEYHISKRILLSFQDRLRKARETPSPEADPELHEAACQGMQSMVEDLESQIQLYETIQSARMDGDLAPFMRDLQQAHFEWQHAQFKFGRALLAIRMASGLSAEFVAQQIGVAPEFLSALEAEDYRLDCLDDTTLGAVYGFMKKHWQKIQPDVLSDQDSPSHTQEGHHEQVQHV